MSRSCVLTQLASAISTAADGSGRVPLDTLRTLGFDDDTIRRHGPDAIRLTMTREITSLSLELVPDK